MSVKQQTYDDHVAEALDDVTHKQHLRFINAIYRTKEVCLAAVQFESTHTYALTDFGSVPMGNLDYVAEQMREIKKNDQYYLDNMEKALIKKKEAETLPGYYGDFATYQKMLDYFGATDYDDMSRKKFAKWFS